MYISIVKMTIITALKWTNQTLWQAAHGDLERGHRRASRRHHLSAPTRRSAPSRPLCYWVRDVKLLPGTGLKDKSVSFNESARKRRKRVKSVSLGVCVCLQPAGGERHPGEVHLWHAGGGLLEPRLHGHTGTQRLRQGERGQTERKGKTALCELVTHLGPMGVRGRKQLVWIIVSWRLPLKTYIIMGSLCLKPLNNECMQFYTGDVLFHLRLSSMSCSFL